MRCPNCGSLDDKVTNSRALAAGDAVRRRRECLSCGFRFTSYERIDVKPFMVIKKDRRREPFERVKIERGVQRAVEKRPVSQMSVERLVNEVEDATAMIGKVSNEIMTSVIGDLVMEKLNELDKVAYIRFASVYRRFETIDEFVVEIQRLEKGMEGGASVVRKPIRGMDA